jgi:hypothetical protein
VNSYSTNFPIFCSKHGLDSSRVGGLWEYAGLDMKWKIILFDPGMVGQGQNPSSLEFEADE